MPLNTGAVVTASIGGPSGKPRPFLVVRSDALRRAFAGDGDGVHQHDLRQPDAACPGAALRQERLATASHAMIDHIQSVRVRHIDKVVGQLADMDLTSITHAMAVYLGIGDTRPRARRK